MINKVIAIDFDGTITLDITPFPITGPIRPEAIKYIKQLYSKGYGLILWTCRTDENLEEAINLLKESKIFECFTSFNDNIYTGNSRKVVADFYVDDKSIMGEVNWNLIYNYIVTYIK